MPILVKARHEAFAQALFRALATGGTQYQAYAEAGYQSKGNHAQRVNSTLKLRAAPEIIERVKELQALAAKDHRITRDSIMKELDEARIVAKEDRAPAAMVAATTSKAKVAGLMVDKLEQGKAGDFDDIESSADLADRLLLDINPGLTITPQLRTKAMDEIKRHVATLSFLATSEDPPENDQNKPTKPIAGNSDTTSAIARNAT